MSARLPARFTQLMRSTAPTALKETQCLLSYYASLQEVTLTRMEGPAPKAIQTVEGPGENHWYEVAQQGRVRGFIHVQPEKDQSVYLEVAA